MKQPLVASLIFFLAGGLICPAEQEPVPKQASGDRPPRRVQRAARPVFSARDQEGIFFADLFRDGLVGERPTMGGNQVAGTAGPASAAIPSAASPVAGESGGGDSEKWSELVSREILENEIKLLQIQLDSQVTTPVRFNTGYREAHHTFMMLATWFSVLHEFDGDIRWKADAPAVLASLVRAEVLSRNAGADAFRYSEQIKTALTDMIRGSSFSGQEKPLETLVWPDTADRSEIMTRLAELSEELSGNSANEKDFQSAAEDNLHRASLVAALARVLNQSGMDNADDAGYRGLATEMERAAVELTQSIRTPNLANAQNALNRIEQSCDNCHGEWR